MAGGCFFFSARRKKKNISIAKRKKSPRRSTFPKEWGKVEGKRTQKGVPCFTTKQKTTEFSSNHFWLTKRKDDTEPLKCKKQVTSVSLFCVEGFVKKIVKCFFFSASRKKKTQKKVPSSFEWWNFICRTFSFEKKGNMVKSVRHLLEQSKYYFSQRE